MTVEDSDGDDLAESGRPLGSGSNEIIEFLAHAFLQADDNIVTSKHAFVAYKLVAKLFGAQTIEAPSPDFRHHLDAILSAITPRTRLVFIANPNNPTGTLVSQGEIDEFMARTHSQLWIGHSIDWYRDAVKAPGWYD